MTKVAVWCRHIDDNIIGADDKLLWNIPSELNKFYRIINGQFLVMGRKTYESLSNRVVLGRKIAVLTSNIKYEVSDKKNHIIVSSLKSFVDFEEDLYICGGAKVYEDFMKAGNKLAPEIIVDCMFRGAVKSDAKSEKIDISSSIDIMNKKYRKISQDYVLDDVVTSIWIKKGEFIEQSVLKRIVASIEEDYQN